MKKATLIIVLSLLFAACKQEKKKIIKKNSNTPVKTYPKFEGDISNIIFDYGYEFADDIVIDYIALEYKGENKYQIIYVLDDKSNLDRIEELKIATIFYPKKPNKFKNQKYRDKKSRQIASKCKIYNNSEYEKIIKTDFEIIPKEFKMLKVYFYNDLEGVINNKIISIRNVNMQE